MAKLLGTTAAEIAKSLTVRVVASKREVVEAKQNQARATYGRDALAKVTIGQHVRWSNSMCALNFNCCIYYVVMINNQITTLYRTTCKQLFSMTFIITYRPCMSDCSSSL